MEAIPFFKPSIEQADIDEVVDTLASGWLTTGPKARKFEAEFACYVQQQHAVAVNSCTAALHLALEAIGLQAGDAVLAPTMTFAATAEVVRYFNAHPVLVDCRTEDLNLDVADAQRRLREAQARGERVVAILPVHYGGQPADMPGVRRLAQQYGLRIIEDAAHCCPAAYREDAGAAWKPVGAEAAVSCYSFYANKTITTGEGGMACTNDAGLADRMRLMSLHGISKDAWKRFAADGSWYYEITAPGFKYNMTDVAAALGLQQLRKADRLHAGRCRVAARYQELLGGVEEIILPVTQPNRVHSWHLFVIRLRCARLRLSRNDFIQRLKERGITASVHWMPLHLHPYYREKYGYRPEDLPIAAGLFSEIISLPIFPDLTDAQIEYVAGAIRAIVAQNLR